MIPDGYLAIADKGYRGEMEKASVPNPLDPAMVAEFKSTVRARHKTFNGRLKNFAVINERLRHKPVMERHKACFEAVAIITQYSIELGNPLFEL